MSFQIDSPERPIDRTSFEAVATPGVSPGVSPHPIPSEQEVRQGLGAVLDGRSGGMQHPPVITRGTGDTSADMGGHSTGSTSGAARLPAAGKRSPSVAATDSDEESGDRRVRNLIGEARLAARSGLYDYTRDLILRARQISTSRNHETTFDPILLRAAREAISRHFVQARESADQGRFGNVEWNLDEARRVARSYCATRGCRDFKDVGYDWDERARLLRLALKNEGDRPRSSPCSGYYPAGPGIYNPHDEWIFHGDGTMSPRPHPRSR